MSKTPDNRIEYADYYVLREGKTSRFPCVAVGFSDYDDASEKALEGVVQTMRSVGPIKLAIQLGHAGRKASSARPWEGRGALTRETGAWETQAPSPIALANDWPVPHALTLAEMESVKQSCVAAVKRAARAGLDFVELHSTHGYLFSEFLSPLSNKRTDDYGGSLQNRMRFPLAVFEAMRDAWPQDRFIGAKISGFGRFGSAMIVANVMAIAK